MKRPNICSAKALLAVATLTFSPAAWSLGLGDAMVESYLNQPLRARIDLISSESDDLASVSAKLASAEDYELIGASLEDLSMPVQFTIENIEGDAYLLARSSVPVSNPIVRLIVEVNWSSGRMLREYTLFLDPPMMDDQAPVSEPLPRVDQREPAQAAPSVTAAEPAAPPATSAAPATSEPEVAAPAQRPASRAPAAGEYGPVSSGETLWGIARDWARGTNLDVNKVMIAIQRENPDAFLNDNINLLKRGAILRMPGVGEVEQISSRSAYNEVLEQEQAFKGAAAISSTAMPLISEDAAAAEMATDDLYASVEPEEVSPAAPATLEEEATDTVVQETAAEETFAEEAETALQDDAAPDAAPETETEAAVAAEPMGQLELVPPSQASELDSTYGFEESEEGGDASLGAQALRENLARAEEELITQQQQNAYLEERIKELESQLEEAQAGNVADADMANMEQRLREERLAAQEQEPQSLLSRFGLWGLGLLVLVAALLGWRLTRRKADAGAAEDTIQELTDEAEEVLRVLEEPEGGASDEADQADTEPAEPEEEEPAAEASDAGDDAAAKPARFGKDQEEADILDEESSDPEIQLDLARAYISMGDKEAARVILQEVATNGSEEQQAEAQKMLDLI